MAGRARSTAAAIAVVAAMFVASADPAAAAFGLSISTPPGPLALAPGATATSSGLVAVTPDVLNPAWSLSVSDATGNGGHLAKGVGSCGGVESQTANQLRALAKGSLPATSATGAQVVGSSPLKIAGGVGLEPALQVTFSLAVNSNEILSTACTMQTTVTYTLQ